MDILNVSLLLACFYANGGLIVERNLSFLQRAFDSFFALFNHLGCKTNTKNTKAMVFLLGHIRTCLTADAYEVQMSDLYRGERRGRNGMCQECWVEMAVGSLWSHIETQYNVCTSFALRATDAAPLMVPRHRVAVRDSLKDKYRCPVPGCPQGAEGRG